MRQGIYENLSFSDYLEIDAVNHSNLKNMDTSARYYNKKKDEPNKPSAAMELGTAVHSRLLESETYSSSVTVFDGAVRRGKAWDSFKESNVGKTILKASDYGRIEDIANSVLDNRNVSGIFKNPDAKKELTLVWIDEITGIKCKCRIDAYDGFLHDLKTSSAKTPDEFIRNAYKYFYHSQMAFYKRGIMACGLIFNGSSIIVAQTGECGGSYLVSVPDATLDEGENKVDEWMNTLNMCLEGDTYNGFERGEYSFDLPAWAIDDDNELIIGGKTVEL